MNDSKNNSFSEIAELLKRENGFTLISHISPDGDTLGSALALWHTLNLLGKDAEVVCTAPVPANYRFLPGSNEVKLPAEAKHFQNVVSIDCADEKRMADAAPLFYAAAHTVNIDHHPTNTYYAELNYVAPLAAATGECLYELICLLLGQPNLIVAECLYTALMTDTGNFAYSNTTENTFLVASKLASLGVDLASLNRKVYRTVPVRKVRLLGRALSNMKLLFDGKFAVSVISKEEMDSVGATSEDTEGFIDTLRDIDTVEVAAFLREGSENYHVSLRSKTYLDVSGIASQFGGGGHEHAAGCHIDDLNEAYDAFIYAIKEVLNA